MDERGMTRPEPSPALRPAEESLSRSLTTLRSPAASPPAARLETEDRSSAGESLRPPALKLWPTFRRLSLERTLRALIAVAPSRLIDGRTSG